MDQIHELTVWLGQLKEVFYDAQDVLDEFECEALRRQVVEIQGSTTRKASDVIGRDQDKEQFIECLMHPADDQKVSIISVVGIGGVGKTALTKLAFNDARVVHHFELKQLLVKIIRSITSENCNDLEEEQLQMRLQNILDGKKFLLILDDVWNEDRVKWIELRNLLMGGANGSKIHVTTRSPTIASMMSTMCPYNLKGLPQEECVSLFIKWAFNEGEERQHANLVEIGEETVKKCKGVPLAVKLLGSLLYSKLDERDWRIVKGNEIWKLNKKEGDILSALQLSNNQMLSYLKQCFAYFSFLLKDYKYNTLDLIPFWMAQGLLQSPDENQEPEDFGNQYVDELFSRCFLEDYSDAGYFRLFKIHDFAHDLALSIAQSECLIMNCQT
ncbi:hypothetical protein SO802_015832 [Lithocarpus litseifolius]|uniref:NB-ARC domain-containing protein n=1 Tax=Lithocarpus litseifolius TaxID=425828 RepID=A0AAW2CVC9_9ROSI